MLAQKSNWRVSNSINLLRSDLARLPALPRLATLMVEFGPRWIYQPKCDYGQTVIKVVVGTGDVEKTFTMHKNLLCAASDYFERELNCPSFTESQEMTVTLEEDIPSTFEVLQRWVYSGKIDDSRSYTGGDDLHEDHFWLRVYQLADFLGVRAVQVIAFERFETVFPYTKPIVLPSKEFIKELYETKTSPKALQVYVAGHTAYWMLLVPKKAEKWAALLASQPYYGMDTANVLAKLLPLQTLHPEGFPRAHPAHRRGSFAVDSGLDLDGLRRDANARIMLAETDLAERPALETVVESQPLPPREASPSPPSRPTRNMEENSARDIAYLRSRKRVRRSLFGVATHTVEEASISTVEDGPK